MSGNSSLNPQVGASATDVWQQFFREALRKRGKASPPPADEAEFAGAAEMRATADEDALPAGAPDGAAAAAASPDESIDDESPRPRLSLSPLEVAALGLFGASVFCFVSLLLYNPGDYFNAEVLRTRAEVSFGVGKAIFRPFGLAVYAALGFTLFWSGAVFFRQGVRGVVLKAFGTAVFTTALAGLLGLAFPGEDGAGTLVHGGVVGEFLSRRMTGSFDTLGATALLILVSLISLIFATDWFFTSLAREGGTALADDADTPGGEESGDDDDAEAIPATEETPAGHDARGEDGGDEDESESRVPPALVPEPRPSSARRLPEPVPIEPVAAEAEPDPEPAAVAARRANEEAEAAAIIAKAVRASSPKPAAPPRRRERPAPEFDPVNADGSPAAAEAAPETTEPSEFEPPRRGATSRQRLRWRRRDEAVAPEPEFGAGLRETPPPPPVEEVSAPIPLARPVFENDEPEPDESLAAPEPVAAAPADEPAGAFGLADPEDDVAVAAIPAAEPEEDAFEPVPAAPAESSSAPVARKAQLSLFDEVIDEISRAGRESRSSAPRRPSSPIPPVPPPAAPASIDDATYDEAVRIVLEAGRGSVSLLQRRLDVGYVTANRLLELMERDGVVGEHRGSGPREVRTTIEEWMRRNPSGRTPG